VLTQTAREAQRRQRPGDLQRDLAARLALGVRLTKRTSRSTPRSVIILLRTGSTQQISNQG
jgi:hypothetical protein